MIDLHIHSSLCPHGKGVGCGEVDSVKDIRYFGFAEHLPLPQGFTDPAGDSAISAEMLEEYVALINQAKEEHPNILLGGELDYMPGFEIHMERLAEDKRFDYIIGSVHFLNRWGFDYSQNVFEKGLAEIYHMDGAGLAKGYYQSLRSFIRGCKFDVVGHLDLVKKFNTCSRYFDACEPEVFEEVEKTLDLVKAKGVAVEVNTAGLRKPVAEMYPSQGILKSCCERDIPLTLGSDAHSPGEVGAGFSEALDAIKKAGFDRLHYVKGRRKTEVFL